MLKGTGLSARAFDASQGFSALRVQVIHLFVTSFSFPSLPSVDSDAIIIGAFVSECCITWVFGVLGVLLPDLVKLGQLPVFYRKAGSLAARPMRAQPYLTPETPQTPNLANSSEMIEICQSPHQMDCIDKIYTFSSL